MTNDLKILQVYMKKIDGTECDYELITQLNDAFKILSKEAQETINEVSEEYVKTIKKIIGIDKNGDEII